MNKRPSNAPASANRGVASPNADSHSDTDSMTGTVTDQLLIERHAAIATLTLNRPQQYNALSESLLTQLSLALNSLASDDDVRVVVMAANGRAFCAGHDLKEMRANPGLEYQTQLFTLCSQMMLTIAQLPKPVIARVHGPAVAAGCQLVAACDLAISARSARFAVSGINLGLFCGTPSIPLSRDIPRKRALQMLFLGEQIDAQTAAAWHLVNECVDDDELDLVIGKWATVLADKPAAALAMGKKLWNEQNGKPLDDAYSAATKMMAANMMLPETQQGIDDFIEKRSPERPTT